MPRRRGTPARARELRRQRAAQKAVRRAGVQETLDSPAPRWGDEPAVDPRQLGTWRCGAVARASQVRGEHVELPLQEQPRIRVGGARGRRRRPGTRGRDGGGWRRGGDGGDGSGEQEQTRVRAVAGGAGGRGGAGRQRAGRGEGGGARGGNGGGSQGAGASRGGRGDRGAGRGGGGGGRWGVGGVEETHLGVGAKGYAAGEGIRGPRRRGVGLWDRSVAPGTPDPPKESGAVGKAPGRGRVARVRRVQGAGAGINGAAGKALEAQALGTPPLRLDGVAGADAGVVEHGRGSPGPSSTGACCGHGCGRRRVWGWRGCGSVLLVRTGVGRRGARARGLGRRREGGGQAAAPTGDDSAQFRTGGGGSHKAGRRGVGGGGLYLSPASRWTKGSWKREAASSADSLSGRWS